MFVDCSDYIITVNESLLEEISNEFSAQSSFVTAEFNQLAAAILKKFDIHDHHLNHYKDCLYSYFVLIQELGLIIETS